MDSSSSKLGKDCPKADALLGVVLGFLSRRTDLFGSPAVPRTLDENLGTLGLPYRDGGFAGVAIVGRGAGVSCNLRTGESGRGRDVLGRFP